MRQWILCCAYHKHKVNSYLISPPTSFFVSLEQKFSQQEHRTEKVHYLFFSLYFLVYDPELIGVDGKAYLYVPSASSDDEDDDLNVDLWGLKVDSDDEVSDEETQSESESDEDGDQLANDPDEDDDSKCKHFLKDSVMGAFVISVVLVCVLVYTINPVLDRHYTVI